MFSRRAFLRSTATAAIATIPLAGSSPAWGRAVTDPLPVVADGRALATVWIGADADRQTRHAADELVAWIAEATGVTLPQRTLTADPPAGPALLVGTVVGQDVSVAEIAALGADGFIQRRVDGRVTIVGSDAFGTRFGVYDFLERQLDIRWVMPDEVIDGVEGADVPHRSTVSLGTVATSSTPAFSSRLLHPFPLPDLAGLKWDNQPGTPWIREQMNSWGHYARVHNTIFFQHNLWAVLPPAKYADPQSPDFHPEFYPMHGGERFLPGPSARTGWQPDFGASGLAEVVAHEVLAQLDADPELTTFSLAMNDGQGFSDDDLDNDVLNHFLMPSASESYYRFVNDVVERVTASKPTIIFGVLAYTQVADPPSFPLHPAVVPYLTCDTSRWADPKIKAYDQAWARNWADRANRIGWWNYSYGNPYLVPRLFLDDLAEAYRFMRDIGVTGVMAELRPSWGEGPKPWLMARLYWDPDTNVHAAVNDWARHAVGAPAALHVRRYYEIWERFWSDEVPGGEWFAASQRIYATFRTAEYLEQITEAEVIGAGKHLAAAEAKAMTDAQRSRLRALQRYHDYFEASVASYPRRVARPTTVDAARHLLDDTAADLDRLVDAARRRLELASTLTPDPDPARYSLVWSGWNLYAVWEISEYLRGHESGGGPITDRVRALLDDPSGTVARMAQLILDLNSERRLDLGQNTSFDTGDAAGWTLPAGTSTKVTGEVAHTEGGKSLLLEPLFSGAITQEVQVQPGFFRFGYHIFVPPAETPLLGWYAKVDTFVYNTAGQRIQRIERQFAHQPAVGQWYEIHYADFLPVGAVRALVRIVIEANHKVYVDDVSITQVRPPAVGDRWTPVVTDTFTSETVGTSPSTFAQTDPPGAVVVVNAGGEHGSVAQFTGVGERTSVESALRPFDPVLGVLKFSFDLRKDTGRIGTAVRLVDAEGRALAYVGQSSAGDLRYSDGATSRISGATIVDGQWYALALLLRPDQGVYELYVDGAAVVTGALDTTAGPVAGLRLESNRGYFDGEAVLSIDNIELAVPAS